MKNKEEIKELLLALSDKMNKFEKGDLFSLSEIKDGFDLLMGGIGKFMPKGYEEQMGLVSDFFSVEINVNKTDEYFAIATICLKCFSEIIENGKKSDDEFVKSCFDDFKEKITGYINKNILDVKKDFYPADYFANLVDDKEMLSKFCDEIKEHLDESQITLVDLEYDSTNQENINKVFRAFHTAKSSSAFLGVKNIEEIAHKMEDLLMLVRDGKLQITKDLIDVVFYGINFIRQLSSIIESENYEPKRIIECFNQIDIYKYIAVISEILAKYATKKIGEILLDEGKLDKQLVDEILVKQKDTDKKFGEIAIEEKYISEDDLLSAVKKQTQKAKSSVFVKVSNSKLNELVDLVGELVITQSMVKQSSGGQRVSGENGAAVDCTFNDSAYVQLEKITTSIKNIVLSMGMVPVSEIFNKLRVVVRNAANDLGKMINLEIDGENAELDRNVIENIYDPLVHIVRNSVDHGIEDGDERQSAGKNKIGKIKIEALHKGNNIEIQITDDGRGIDKEAVIRKAIERGLIDRDKSSDLDDKDIYSFIFLPGFSTAKKVTELSGRGVGLDVVKKNIEQIHGKVEIKSVKGQYSQFIIKLPLTLAIIDGFVTVVSGVKYIFPFNLIEEIIIPDDKKISRLDNGQLMLYLRNNYIPVIFAGEILKEENFNRDLDKILIIIINYQNRLYGIAVDSIAGKQEIVIKNLNQALNELKVFSGGTIFGDGTIGFVVDIEEFMDNARRTLK